MWAKYGTNTGWNTGQIRVKQIKQSGVGQIQGGGGKVHEALIHSRLMHTRTNMRRIRSALISVASKQARKLQATLVRNYESLTRSQE